MARPHFRLSELATRLGAERLGEADPLIRQVASLATARADEISFFNKGAFEAQLAATAAGAVIVAPDDAGRTTRPRLAIANPYLAFARVSQWLNPVAPSQPGVHPSAVVDPSAAVDAGATVGAQAVIGASTRIAAGAVVGTGCVIGDDCVVGAGTVLHARVTLYQGTRIGDRCVVHSGAVIGADGFGFANDRGRWEKIPQIGCVVIESDVEIGANTTIDRGALDDTLIATGAKLDNQIQIGHNCRIGAHTAIAGCVGIAGSTSIGAYCMIGGAAMIAGHLSITDRVIIAGGTLVSKSIAVAGAYAGPFPFDTQKQWQRTAVRVRNLDDLAARVAALERSAGAGRDNNND
jgi:UDP-3-O-[3-hydroxymyristoyl] glucosamine N-acyltransferase